MKLSLSWRLSLGLLLVLGTSDAALAHAHLKTANPAENAVLSVSPATLTLQFSEALVLKFSGVTVTGPGKSAIKLGAANLGSEGGATLQVAVPSALPAGAYVVHWHILSTDGHKTKGSYTFTLKP